MGDSKKKKEKKRGSIFKSKWLAVILILLIFCGMLCFYPDNNIFTWMDARREIREQERQKAQYLKEIDAMRRRIDNLTSDKDTLETFARENFHFAKDSEDVYIIRQK